MKKFAILFAIVALVCFTVPAMAVDWNFYGNARMATFYVSDDFGDGTNAAGTDDKDTDLQWDFQTNSRIGAKIKAENIKAQFEFGVSESNVSSRRLYGVWNFGPAALKVGKDYTPVHDFISGQVFNEDLGLLGFGTGYGSRHGQLALSFGGFNIALVNPSSGDIRNAAGAPTAGDVDEYLPKIEAGYGMALDNFNFYVWGGLNTYTIEDAATATGTEDVDVTSWTIGGDAGFNFGPGYVKGAISYSVNPGNAGWHIPGLATGGAFAEWDGDDGTNDVDVFMAALVAGLKMSDMLSFEAGFGYRQDDPDYDVNDNKTKAWNVYGQAVVALAPGVFVIPEVGYADFDDDYAGSDEGNMFYLGAKWQINF